MTSHRTRLAVGTAALATLLAPLALSPASADEARPAPSERTEVTGGDHQRRSTGGSASTTAPSPDASADPQARAARKAWGKVRSIRTKGESAHRHELDVNSRGDGVVAWLEYRGDRARPAYARISPKGKVSKPRYLAGWGRQELTGDIGVGIDDKGGITAVWTKRAGKKKNAVLSARISRKGKVKRSTAVKATKLLAWPQLEVSRTGHAVLWYGRELPGTFGVPSHFVSLAGSTKWREAPWTIDPAWASDGRGHAVINDAGTMVGVWAERHTSGTAGRVHSVTMTADGAVRDEIAANGSSRVMNASVDQTSAGDAVVSYTDALTEPPWTDLLQVVRRPAGGAWTMPETLPNPNPGGGTWQTAVTDAGKVAVMALAYTEDSNQQQVVVATQEAPGAAWTLTPMSPMTPNRNIFQPYLAMGANGTVYAAWDTNGKNNAFAVSRQSASGWQATRMGQALMPEMAVDAKGRALVAWQDDRKGKGAFLRIRRSAAP